MLIREKDFSCWFGLTESDESLLQNLAREAAHLANGMTHYNDYFALGAYCLSHLPESVFEIGTYLGVTANFLLKLLPKANVISIAYVNPPRPILGKRFNNSELKKSQVGSLVEKQNRSRLTQLFGDSHKLSSQDLVLRFGKFDMVLIDGDHSCKGVELDTELAKIIINEDGAICWHDANPKNRYLEVREFLEGMSMVALATSSDYVGGIACWNQLIEQKLLSAPAHLIDSD